MTISITGHLTIERSELDRLLQFCRPPSVAQDQIETDRPASLPTEIGRPRLAYTMRGTAEMLGISYQTAYRLVKRGLLKPSDALRSKIISRTEIERFLRETSRAKF
jgi:hypothetical protein